jgi:hypothetical protein
MFNRTNSLSLIAGVTLVGLLPDVAFSQTLDGALGATSTGQIGIELQVDDSVEITSLNTINFGSYGGGDTGDINREESFCVYVNGSDQFSITPTSTNRNFVLIGAAGKDEIEYSVKFANSATGASLDRVVSYNSPSATFLGSQLRDCGGKDNTSIDVSIPEQEIRDATTDNYTDTLILLVNPV